MPRRHGEGVKVAGAVGAVDIDLAEETAPRSGSVFNTILLHGLGVWRRTDSDIRDIQFGRRRIEHFWWLTCSDDKQFCV